MDPKNQNDQNGFSEANQDVSARMVADALLGLQKENQTEQPPQETTPQNEEVKKAEVTDEKKTNEQPATTEGKEVKAPQSETPATTEKGTEKPEKPLYTSEEIEAELRLHGDLAQLDSSRLSPEGKLIQASMQRGFTPKLQEAAQIKKDYQEMVKKERERAEKEAKEKAEEIYTEDIEKFGEEIATIRKEAREAREAIEQLRQEREVEKTVLLREQQKLAAQQFHNAFVEKASAYGIPATKEFEEEVMGRVVAENQLRMQTGEPLISVEDGLRLVSSVVVPNTLESLEKLLSANPKLLEAFRDKVSREIVVKGQSGPTVIKPSGGGGTEPMKSAPSGVIDKSKVNDPNFNVADAISAVAMELYLAQKT